MSLCGWTSEAFSSFYQVMPWRSGKCKVHLQVTAQISPRGSAKQRWLDVMVMAASHLYLLATSHAASAYHESDNNRTREAEVRETL